MRKTDNSILMSAIMRLMYPLVRLLIRYNVSVALFTEWVKWVYVDVANKEYEIEGKKQTNSRIAVISGLTRKEVQRIKKLDGPDNEKIDLKSNRILRVINGWQMDPAFCNNENEAVLLKLEGAANSFQALVLKYSGDMPFVSVLDEMKQANIIEVKSDEVQLIKTNFMPVLDDDKINILGLDTSLLIDTIDFNIQNEFDDTYFQKKVLYHNLSQEAVEKFRTLQSKKNMDLLMEYDEWLSQGEHIAREGERSITAGVGIYYFQHDEITCDEITSNKITKDER